MVSLHPDLHSHRLETPISPTISWRQLAANNCESSHVDLSELTPAEQVVVTYLRQGLSNKEIARALGKSAWTVKNQVSSCLTKLGVCSRSRLIALLR